MAVKIRLSRIGRRNRPCWRIVAVDEHKRRDGAYLEYLGTYDPIKGSVVVLHTDRIKAWVDQGAQCSDAVIKILKNQ